MTERVPNVSELRQWSLLLQLHESGGGKLGSFLKNHDYPRDATQKPLGKYYGQIRNKNVQIMSMPDDRRIDFIMDQIRKGSDELTDVKQLPSVNRIKLVDILAGLSITGKRKMISILKDLSCEEQEQLIGIIGGI